MAVTDRILVAGSSMFGIGLQAGKGAPRAENTRYKWYPFTGMPYGPNQQMATLPPEAGRSITPRGAYKSGIQGAGQFTLIPRVISDIADLLLATMGKDTVTTGNRIGKASDGSPFADTVQVGSNIHSFAFDAIEGDIPYLTTRRVLEGQSKLGEVIQDNRVASLELTFPNAGPVTASVELAGRIPSTLDMFVPDPTTTWALGSVSYESDDGFVTTLDPASVVRIGGASLYCTGLTVAINNNLLQGDASRIIGDYTPLDFPVINRGATIRAMVLVTNYNLYRDLYAGGHAVADTKFKVAIQKGDIFASAYSPLTFNSGNTQYALNIMTDDSNIAWALPAPLPMNPQAPVMLTLVGTVLRPTTVGKKYLQLRLQNGTATAYTHYKAIKTGTTISFSTTTGNHILDSGTGFVTGGFTNGDKVCVVGSNGNDGVYTVTAVAAGDLTVTESVTVEAAGANITITA